MQLHSSDTQKVFSRGFLLEPFLNGTPNAVCLEVLGCIQLSYVHREELILKLHLNSNYGLKHYLDSAGLFFFFFLQFNTV